MTNKEFYGDSLQIVINSKYANIYRRSDNDMDLLECIFGDTNNIFDLVET